MPWFLRETRRGREREECCRLVGLYLVAGGGREEERLSAAADMCARVWRTGSEPWALEDGDVWPTRGSHIIPGPLGSETWERRRRIAKLV